MYRPTSFQMALSFPAHVGSHRENTRPRCTFSVRLLFAGILFLVSIAEFCLIDCIGFLPLWGWDFFLFLWGWQTAPRGPQVRAFAYERQEKICGSSPTELSLHFQMPASCYSLCWKGRVVDRHFSARLDVTPKSLEPCGPLPGFHMNWSSVRLSALFLLLKIILGSLVFLRGIFFAFGTGKQYGRICQAKFISSTCLFNGDLHARPLLNLLSVKMSTLEFFIWNRSLEFTPHEREPDSHSVHVSAFCVQLSCF